MPAVLVLLASALFGTTGTTRALGLPDTDPFVTGALRLAIGGLLLGAIALLPTRRRAAARPPVPLRRALPLIAIGALGVVAYQPTFFTGVRENGVAVGTLVALGSAPVFTGLCAWALLARRPDARWFGCTALAIVGTLLLSGVVDGAGASGATAAGFLGSLAAGLSYAAYTLAVKGLLDLGWRTLPAVGAVFGAAGVVGLAELVAVGGVALDGTGLAAACWLGVLTITVAYVLFGRGLERLPAATVSTLTLAEPVVAAVLGVALLGERLSVAALLGAALLVVALALLGLPARSRRPRPVEAA